MILHNILVLCFLFILCFFALIRQHNYLITALVSKTYKAFTLIISFVILVITFFINTNTNEIILGILYAVIFLLFSFMRKGITKKAFIGSKGDYCKWNKIDNVNLIKKDDKIQLTYYHSGGNSNMFFNSSDLNKLVYILTQYLSDEKINFKV